MARRNVVVFAPAPIPVGNEMEVHLVNATKTVVVRDLSTGILYGSGATFDPPAKEDVVDGHRSDFRRGRIGELARVESVYRARVVECVIANVSQSAGFAPCTSFVVEVLDASAGPYRG
jgi:hypothetical protein